MKRYSLMAAATLFAGSLLSAQAGTKDEVTQAIKKLSEKGNYSWNSTSKRPERPAGDDGNRRGGTSTSTGKTADGLILTSRSYGERTFESLRKGEKFAFKRENEWTVPEPREGQGQRRGRGFGGSRSSAPAAQAAELLEKVGELKKDGDVYSGALTEEGAKSLLSFGGGRRGGGDNAERPQPKGAKASAKFWIKDGVLAKYETTISGSITFNDNERDLSRVTSVEINNVGSTKIDVPDDIKKKLETKSEDSGDTKKETAPKADPGESTKTKSVPK